MFNKLFRKQKDGQPSASATSALAKIEESLEMLDKKEQVIQRKISAELKQAIEFTKAKNKRAAINCLKRKKLFEGQAERLGQYQLRLHEQVILLGGAKAAADTVEALRSGAHAMKAVQKATNIDDVDRTMEDINEQQDNMKQMQDALSMPAGVSAEFDDDELDAELEELESEDLDEELVRPVTKVSFGPIAPEPVRPVTKVPVGPIAPEPVRPEQQAFPPVRARPSPQKALAYADAEDGELRALQKEMAL